MAARFRRWRWNVHGWAAIKEAVRTETEAEHGHGHYRPILGTRDMVVSEHVPEGNFGIVHFAVGLGPLGQAVAGGVLIRVVAGSEAFFGAKGRHPEMVRSEAGAAHDSGIGLHERRTVFARHKAVAHWAAQTVLLSRIDHAPEARGG